MKELLLIPIVHTPIFLLYAYLKYGMTVSISAIYKNLVGWEKVWFIVTLWAIAIPVMIVGIQAVPDGKPEILFFLSGSLIALIGASPMYWGGKDTQEYWAHMIGSYGGIITGMLAFIVYFYFLPIVWIFIGVYAIFTYLSIRYKLPNETYWVEIGAIVTAVSLLYLIMSNQQLLI